MKGIWSYRPMRALYSHEAKKYLFDNLDTCRALFRKEFRNAIELRDGLYCSSRFYSDENILNAMESNIPENEFLAEPMNSIYSILMGAAETDYYYCFEKEW